MDKDGNINFNVQIISTMLIGVPDTDWRGPVEAGNCAKE
jgi:hypothetical protein